MESQKNFTVVVVGNRHQFLNALKACAFLNVPSENCLLVISSHTRLHHSQVLSAAKEHQWYKIFSLLPLVSNRIPAGEYANSADGSFRGIGWTQLLLRYRKLLSLIFQFTKGLNVVHVISGFYAEPVERTIHSFFPDAAYFLVDDGNLTPAVNQRRKTEHDCNFSNAIIQNSSADTSSHKYRMKAALMQWIARVQTKGAKVINFFTDYEFERVLTTDHVIRCQKRSSNRLSVSGEQVHFLGMPGLSRKILSPNHYREFLQALSKCFRDKQLLYYCHPAETIQDLEPVKEFMKPERIIRNSEPYDMHYLSLEAVPFAIVGFYSSTFNSLAMVNELKSDLFSIEIPQEYFLCSHRKSMVADIYRQFSRNPNIRIVSVETLCLMNRDHGNN